MNKLLVTSSAQIHHRDSTARIMWTVVICLVPAGIWSVLNFGLHALFTLILSIAAAVGTEAIISHFAGKKTISDGSAALTGLLIGYNMPPLPVSQFYIPILASVFAIAVVKWSFGGLGGNWMNPALAGRVFVFFSWTSPMTRWQMPLSMQAVDTVSGASPLGFVKSNLLTTTQTYSGPMDFLDSVSYPVSKAAASISDWFSHIGLNINARYIDAFVGNSSGCIGEVSALLLIIGAVYLFRKKIITWDIPVSYLLSFGLLIWMFGGKMFGNGLFTGDIFFHIFSGGFMLGCLYMATDMVTSPLTRKGRIIFGAGIGFITFLIRIFGSFPEGVSLAIIIMNIFVPLIDRFSRQKRFGIPKKGQVEA